MVYYLALQLLQFLRARLGKMVEAELLLRYLIFCFALLRPAKAQELILVLLVPLVEAPENSVLHFLDVFITFWLSLFCPLGKIIGRKGSYLFSVFRSAILSSLRFRFLLLRAFCIMSKGRCLIILPRFIFECHSSVRIFRRGSHCAQSLNSTVARVTNTDWFFNAESRKSM